MCNKRKFVEDNEDILTLIECPICLKPMGFLSKTLTCGHVFCSPCLSILLSSNAPTCSTCRSVIDKRCLKQFPTCVIVNRIADKMNIKDASERPICPCKECKSTTDTTTDTTTNTATAIAEAILSTTNSVNFNDFAIARPRTITPLHVVGCESINSVMKRIDARLKERFA